MNETIGTAANLRRVFSGGGRAHLRHSLALNVGAPFVAYWFMTRHGVPGGDALLVSAAFPLVGVVAAAARTRRLDLIGALSLATLALGLLGAFVFHDPRFVLLKESAVTGLIGAACLGSLLAPRPLLFALGRQLSANGDREALARYDARWADPDVRARSRRMTLVWGVGLLAEATVRG
ncbi:MAG TPA: VC0807 family protein [Thermomicrobiales bacterium]|nr:VC0807 family protein [Thermomicrobiales bacterium]